MLRVFFGHHKCASQWVTLIIERICNEMGLKSICAYQDTINKYGSLQHLLEIEKPDFLILPESNHNRTLEIKSEYLGFHIIRDPRDIIVSCYFSHKKSHKISNYIPTLEHREKLNVLPKKEGLDFEFSISHVFIENLYHWKYNYSNIYETKFEILTQYPEQEFYKILSFLDMLEDKENFVKGLIYDFNRFFKKMQLNPFIIRLNKYNKNQLNKIIKQLSFANLKTEKNKNLGKTTSHYRKGESGDWKNHLDATQEKMILDFFPNILEKLKY